MAGLMLWMESKAVVSANKTNCIQSSLKTITTLTEMPLKVIFHTVEVNHHSICNVLGLY